MIETSLIQRIYKYKEDHEGKLPRQIIMEPKIWLEITGRQAPNDDGTYRYMGIPIRFENKMPDEVPSTDIAAFLKPDYDNP